MVGGVDGRTVAGDRRFVLHSAGLGAAFRERASVASGFARLPCEGVNSSCRALAGLPGGLCGCSRMQHVEPHRNALAMDPAR